MKRYQSYRAAAAAGCEGVGGAVLAVGAFLSGVRGGFRLCVCRGRDFLHSLTLSSASAGGAEGGLEC